MRGSTILVRALSVLITLSCVAFAQSKSGGSRTSSPTSTNTPCAGQTGLPGGNLGGLGGDCADTQIQRPVFLSGKVALSDGTVPPEPVKIERVCNGSPKLEGYTDRKGHFSFEVGRNMEIPDASTGRDRGTDQLNSLPGSASDGARGMGIDRRLFGCDIRAVLPGYRSNPITLSAVHYMDNPDLGTIILHRLGNSEGLTISATSSLAPKDARKAFEKGLEAAGKGKTDEAKTNFEKATAVYPRYAAAWFELGKLNEQSAQLDAARKNYEQALEADSKYVQPYERLSLIALKAEDWQGLAGLSDKLLSLDPLNFPSAYYMNGVANMQLQHYDVAEKNMREAIRMDSANKNPRSQYVLGLVLAQKHDFVASAESLRAFLAASPQAPDAEIIRKQLSEVEESARIMELRKQAGQQ